MQSEKDLVSGGVTWTDYLYAGGQMFGMHVTPAGGAAYNRFFILDHLGSMSVMTGDVGCVGLTYGGANSCLMERKSYDAWGKRRFATNWADDTNSTLVSATTRGFTGHEMVHAPGFDLINMNARFYDPATARFMSTDPLIQDVTNLQDLNPYSYVLNNPLSAIDPSGACGGLFGVITCPFIHAADAIGSFLRHNQILGDLYIIASGFACGPGCAGAAASSIAFFETGRIAPALEAGAITVAEAGAFHLVGLYSGEELGLGNIAWAAANPLGYAEDITGDGLVGGLASLASGGSFESGFLASGFAGAAGVLQFSQFGAGGNLLANLSAQSVEGGLGSIIGGGNFANGAETGAFRYLFNQGGSGCHGTAQCEQDEAAIGKVDLALGGFAATLLAPEIELGELAVSGVEDGLSFFDGTSYTPKVLQQMQGGAGEFHSFPESATAFEGDGTVSTVTGGDGSQYEMLRIPGSYQSSSGNWYDGYFEFMKDSDGAINHRYFNPSTGGQ